MNCIDLREWAGNRYKWRYEEFYRVERDASTRGDGRWYVEVICRRGLIYPYGGDDLLSWTPKPRLWAAILALDARVTVHQRGSREVVLRFPAGLLDRVAAILQPRLRRHGRPGGNPEALVKARAAQAAKKSA